MSQSLLSIYSPSVLGVFNIIKFILKTNIFCHTLYYSNISRVVNCKSSIVIFIYRVSLLLIVILCYTCNNIIYFYSSMCLNQSFHFVCPVMLSLLLLKWRVPQYVNESMICLGQQHSTNLETLPINFKVKCPILFKILIVSL